MYISRSTNEKSEIKGIIGTKKRLPMSKIMMISTLDLKTFSYAMYI